MSGFPQLLHDHDLCIRAALDAADRECRRRGARLTTIRRTVLELVWQSHRPIGAYALLEQLGRPAAPPTVYRALDFLLAHGLIHRVASRNGFIGCPRPGHDPGGQILLCRQCGVAVELADPGIDQAITAAARGQGFVIVGMTVEIEGICPRCAGPASPATV